MRFTKLKKYLSITTGLILLSLSAIAIGFTVRESNDVGPDNSQALFGGKLESGYPFAGYLINYLENNKVKICGSTFLKQDTVVTAAHCINDNAQIYAGNYDLEFNIENNYQATEVKVKPGWEGTKQLATDLAVVKLTKATDEIQTFAQIGTPEYGCEYEVVAYGTTSETDTLNQPVRKSSVICIEKIDLNLIYLKGSGGGICFGDSGSPIYKKGTREIVGVISSITTKNNSSQSPCSIDNNAIAVRLDSNIDFINSIDKTEAALPRCGESCRNGLCSDGLSCNNGTCLGPNNSCSASNREYCSFVSGISCTSDFTCISNTCKLTPSSNVIDSSLISATGNFNQNLSPIVIALGSLSGVSLMGAIYLIIKTLRGN